MTSQLSQLVSLISNATKSVEDAFAKTAKPDVPSLDDTTPHPLDDQVSSTEMREAIQTIEGACAQLCALVAHPNRAMLNSGPRMKEQNANMIHLCFRTDETNKAAAMLTENLKDPDWGHSYSPVHTPFNSWSKYPGTMFSWYQGPGTDIGAAKGIRFGKGMKGWGDFLETSAVVNAFPWSDLRDGAIVCDMGGGIGIVSMQLVDAYPNLRIVLQDVPAQIEVAKNEVWPKFCPMAIGEGRVEFKAMDFFAELPVKGCDVYFLKNILHDWPDKECKMILRNLVNAMSANSRLLINDYIIQHVNRDGNTPGSVSDLKLAPEPLLPNYGAGGMTQYNMDLAVMCLFNSQERTLEHFIELCQEVGLKFVRVWDAGETSIVEFRLE
ncbi:S-adenosyl-L-methionine-dependent methyltransferase [Guyanagaster necrorhizus]|uniref:S-adenosyl-L-methionine-dependent methyltransferase n=1 Tax=Guyanagaster necrorhizus TaxID=856835 RepID=A0A9P7VJF9_9AGAR|nr:S-adenosyl-L-methionine-dependent methyltransferase [Guyanagaster necrorhizus MCA 3950]KAG7441668.1 S-adenosyl-L-methionine-dependent methyltransferase [Guyanagaster necrorhizus MCA 3950]